MTSATIPQGLNPKISANAFLDGAARVWFAVALAGQWALLYYIVSFYAAPTLTGHFAAWSRNTMLLKGYVAGDPLGNLAFAGHVMLAAVVSLGGAVQLIPAVRRRLPALHRWNGRLFMLAVLGAAISGVAMVWIRGASASPISAVAVSLNAVLDIAFVALAWRSARQREFAEHGRWATRAYLVANGQFFMRVGVFGWLMAFQSPFGMTDRMDGPADIFFEFGSYLLPLAMLELYRRVGEGGRPLARFAMAVTLVTLTMAMMAGVIGFNLMLRHQHLI